jgi:predicted O-methyltransferase YrrM
MVETTKAALKDFELEQYADVFQMKGVELIKKLAGIIDFAFIDSSAKASERKQEIEMLVPQLKRLQMFALHDTAPHQGQMIEMAALLPKYLPLMMVYLNTPRGLSLFQKV